MPRIRQAHPTDAAGIAQVQVEAWRATYPGLVPAHVLVSMSLRRHRAQWANALDCPRVRHAALVATLDNPLRMRRAVGETAGGGERVVGFGSCGPAREASLQHAGEIYTLYVLPEYHERGIGRRLLHGLFDCLLARGMDSALVWVLADNPSRFFYECMGGRRVAQRDENIWGTMLREAAYGWSDFRIVGVRHDAQRRRR